MAREIKRVNSWAKAEKMNDNVGVWKFVAVDTDAKGETWYYFQRPLS